MLSTHAIDKIEPPRIEFLNSFFGVKTLFYQEVNQHKLQGDIYNYDRYQPLFCQTRLLDG